jgi:predicted Zn finger-like uncharacterized protein
VIVTCERCATQFQLDDERVPDEGVRVRCSRCKHAFFIERPASTQAEMIHSVAQRALADQETPEATHDLPSDDGSPPLADQRGIGSSAGEGGSPWADEEDDWQFNLDGPPEDGFEQAQAPTSPDAAPEVDDELLTTDADFDAAGAHFGIGSEEAEGEWDEAPLVRDLDAEIASDLDLVGDDSPSVVAEPEPEPELEPELESGLELEPEPEAEPEPAEEFEQADPWEQLAPTPEMDADPAPEVPETLPAEPLEELEGPTTSLVSRGPDELAGSDEWDLFGSDVPAEEIQSVDRPQSRSLGTVPAARRPSVPAGPAEHRRVLPRSLQRVGRAAGWMVALGLFGFGLHGGLAGAVRQVAPPSTAVEIGSMRLQDVSGHWIDNLVAGPLFVVSGVVENPGPGTATRLLVELLDAQGRRVEFPPVFIGPVLSAKALREEDPRSLQRAQEGRGLTAGEARPFHAIVPGVPLEASSFRFTPSTAHDSPTLPTQSATAAAAPKKPTDPPLSASAHP